MSSEVTGPNRDLHSGLYGVQLPINQYFGKMIASLHDENNHITIPGFMTMSNYLLRKELKWQKPL
jgi:hypothetical protein